MDGISEDKVVEAPGAQAPGGKTPKPKKKKNKLVILGVIVVAIVAIGAGLWVWHEQPGFCNAICHLPMDPYLPTYESTPGQPSEDKWGNEVKDANGMLAAVHRADQGTTCMGCHVPTMGEQVSEAMNWITGNYQVVDNEKYGMVLEERTLAQLGEARGISADEFCLNSACHDMTRDDLTAATADLARNPHAWYHEKQDCNQCHKAHRASVMLCTKCHGDAVVPDGWITAAQGEQILAAAA